MSIYWLYLATIVLRIGNMASAESIWQVRTDNGKPAVDAVVTLLRPHETKYQTTTSLHGTTLEDSSGKSVTTKTDANGNFTIKQLQPGGFLAVTGPAGFAAFPAAELSQHSEIKLRPWTHLKGVWLNHGSPMRGEKMLAFSEGGIQQWIGPSEAVTTDEHGGFELTTIPGYPVSINWLVPIDNTGGFAMRPIARFDVSSLQIKEFRIITEGRTVSGRLSSGSDVENTGNLARWRLMFEPDIPGPPEPPKSIDTNEAMVQWIDDWEQTPPGQRYVELKRNGRDAIIGNDGRFTAEAVVPGKYDLHAFCFGDQGEEAELNTKIEIPSGDTPYELRTLVYKQLQNLKKGDVAPGFEVPNLTGGKVSLAEFRGKYVLLDFWAVWCGLCVAEMPNLQSVFNVYKNDSRLTIISLSSDHEMEVPKKFARTHGTEVWNQGFLGYTDVQHVGQAYHIHGIPSIMLVGPDGRILAINLRGQEILSTVSAALGPPSNDKVNQSL